MSIFDVHKVRNHPTWSTFDLSKQSKYTAKLGQLLPVSYREVLPGDKVKMNLSHFTQTESLNENAFTRLKEHYDVFFVPFRLLFDKANEALVDINRPMTADASQPTNNMIFSKLPHTTHGQLNTMYNTISGTYDIFGFDRAENSMRLAQLLGYGNIDRDDSDIQWQQIPLSLMPVAAYQKIYMDFYRYQQWEVNNPYLYNFNWLTSSVINPQSANVLTGQSFGGDTSSYGNCLFDLRYVNYTKDYLFGVLPSQINDVYLPSNNASFTAIGHGSGVGVSNLGTINSGYPNTGFVSRASSGVTSDITATMVDFHTNISVLQLRASFALQKWSEIQQFSDQNYKDKIKHHFNVDVPDYTAHLAQYIGGTSSVIQINDVVNNNLAGGAAPKRAAIANGASTCNISFDAKEHGFIMVMYYATPYIDYDSSICYDPQVTHVTVDDFPRPEFDSLGLAPVYEHNFVNSNTDNVMGYAPRYWDFKSTLDSFYGGFTAGLKNFVVSKDMNTLHVVQNALNYHWFKVSPKDVDNIFVAQADDGFDSDIFRCNLGIDCKIERALSYDGMPY